MLKKYAFGWMLVGFFFLYHSNFREQGVPSDTLDAKIVNFSLLAGDGLDLAPVTKKISENTKTYSDILRTLSQSPRPPSKPIFTSIPFLPVYAWYKLFNGPINLFAVDFWGKFCSVIYALALLTAFYGIALNLGLPGGRALLTTAAFGVGTHVWHGVSQGLWSSTGFAAFFAGGLYFATLPRGRAVTLVAAAFCWGYAIACRQQDALLILPFFVYIALRHRKQWLLIAAPVVGLGVLGLVFNYLSYGSILGTYASGGTSTMVQVRQTGIHPGLTGNMLVGVPGLLFSPSRGLFVFAPFLLFPFYWLWRRRQEVLPTRELTLLQAAGLSLALQLLLMGQYNIWWAGYSWGPRFLTTALPTLFVLFVLALPKKIAPVQRRLLVACVVWAAFTQGLAAYKYHMWLWNWRPVDVDLAPARVWELKDNQIRRAINEPWFKPNWEAYSLDY